MIVSRLHALKDALLLLLWGGLILRLARSGGLASYLHPSLQPFAVASGVLLVVMSLFSLRAIRGPVGTHGCCSDEEHHCHHDHTHCEDHPTKGEVHVHGSPWSFSGIFKFLLLAALPFWVAFSGESRFTISTIQNRGVVDDLSKLPSAQSSASDTGVASVPPSGGPMPLQVMDMLYGIQMPSYREEFEGKEVELTAQFVPMTTGNPKGDRFQAIRMFITCCAADAKPVGVTVRSSSLPKIPEMGWVRIIGKPTFPMEGGRRTALLEATKVESCEAPREPFVY